MIECYIDHTLLKPDATEEQIRRLCNEAKDFHFAAVCVNPTWVKFCAEILKGTDVKICAVVGFPLGANLSEIKAEEARLAVADGASEIDMVMNIGAMKSGKFRQVQGDIRTVRQAAPDAILKVIIETCLLTNDEKWFACQMAERAGADFVKTSTGFSTQGATIPDIMLMRKTVGPKIGVKASGGIKTYEDAKKMIDAGASRIGTSSGVAIVTAAFETKILTMVL